MEKTINWEEREFELVKVAIGGLISNSAIVDTHNQDVADYIALHAIVQAKAVINRLKKATE